jgi:hypothetical protein
LYINKKVFNKRKGFSAYFVAVFGALIFITSAGFIVDAGLSMNTRYDFQRMLERAVMATIAEFEPAGENLVYPTTAEMTAELNRNLAANFLAFKRTNASIIDATITPTIDFDNDCRHSKGIFVSASITVKTTFLSSVGIKRIKLNASAGAVNITKYIDTKDVVLNNDTPFGSTPIPPYYDTRLAYYSAGDSSGSSSSCSEWTLLNSYGDCALPYYSDNISVNNASFMSGERGRIEEIAGAPDGRTVSLGRGGYITIKLPKPIVDGQGMDLQIITRGNRNGYFVFAGIDVNPSNPYINSQSPGDGINWVNISCTGVPINAPREIGATLGAEQFSGILYPSTASGIASSFLLQPLFYGSGYFDLNADCSATRPSPSATAASTFPYKANISTAKYLKIIDDNYDGGYLQYPMSNTTNFAYPAASDFNFTRYGMFTGFPAQGASVSPGVSIDSIGILHQPRLMGKITFYDRDATTNVISSLDRLYGYQMRNDYKRFWGCRFAAGDTWATCNAALDDGVASGDLWFGNTGVNHTQYDTFDTLLY